MSILSGFNSRTHAGCDLCSRHNTHDANNVSIHAPTRGATSVAKNPMMPMLFQFTHPRGVRRTTFANGSYPLDVSIHAPTRGATAICPIERLTSPVSIHAPTRGATHRLRLVALSKDVSIHAPTRGATHRLRLVALSKDVSIHAPTRGATCYLLAKMRFRWFQFTHPRGVRLVGVNLVLCLIPSFNSRTHAGCDSIIR